MGLLTFDRCRDFFFFLSDMTKIQDTNTGTTNRDDWLVALKDLCTLS